MRALFVMDPIDALDVAGDSTLAVMRESSDRGQEVMWCTPRDLYALNGVARTKAELAVVTSADGGGVQVARGEVVDVPLSAFDLVWMRKDPPFDMTYIFATYLLDMVRDTALVINDPWGLKLFNEKVWAMHFAQFQPPTLLAHDAAQIRDFVTSQPHGAVLKPWDGNGGRGVVVTHGEDRNLRSLIDLLTAGGSEYVIAQGYLKDVASGDKRILLLDGEPAGAINRVPGPSDHRANMHVGASVEHTELTASDLAICDALAPHLKEHGQVFVGIDVIGDKLTEINVTSPTGFREVRALTGRVLEAELLDKVLARRAG